MHPTLILQNEIGWDKQIDYWIGVVELFYS